MKTTSLLAVLFFGLLLTPLMGRGETFEARVTVYWRQGSGTDAWTAKGQSSTGAELRHGVCAVDPKVIPYGSRVLVCGMELVAADTGSAVVKRTASKKMGRKSPVIDIFFEKKEDAIRFAESHPHFVMVCVL